MKQVTRRRRRNEQDVFLLEGIGDAVMTTRISTRHARNIEDALQIRREILKTHEAIFTSTLLP